MKPRSRAGDDAEQLLGLDSLTDIVTNSVGMLMVLGVFVALSGLTRVFVVEVPLPAQKSKIPVFFACRENQFVEVEPSVAFAELARGYAGRTPMPVGKAEIQIVGKDKYGWPRLVASTGWRSSTEKLSAAQVLSRMKSRGTTKETFPYFWVYPDCFEQYFEARKLLRSSGYDVGFSPHDKEHTPALCSHEEDCRWEPS